MTLYKAQVPKYTPDADVGNGIVALRLDRPRRCSKMLSARSRNRTGSAVMQSGAHDHRG